MAGLAAAALLLAAPRAGQAAEASIALAIPAQTIERALVALALQARISVARAPGAVCRGLSRPVRGTMTPRAALDRLLDGAGCRAVEIAPGAFRIEGRASPRARTTVAPVPPPPRPASPPVATPIEVQEVIVTAARESLPLSRAPYAASVLSGQALSAAGGADDTALAAAFAGVSATNLGPGRDKLLIRGLSDGPLTGRTQSTVGIYVDDVRITFDAPDPDLRLTDIDRVEILRGPQGSLYGAGSIGGIVHVVTNAPDPAGRHAMAAATGAVTRDGQPSDTFEAMVNLPLGPRAALRLVGYSEEAGGYIDNTGLGQDNVNRTSRDGARGAFRLDLAPDWRFDLGVVYQAIASDDAQYADPRIGPLARDSRLAQPHDNDFLEASAGLHGRVGPNQLTAVAAVVRHEIASTYDASPATPDFGLPAGPAAGYGEDQHIQLVTQEVTLASPADGRLRWLVGAFFSDGERREADDLATLTGLSLYRERRTDQINEAAIYGEASLPLGAITFTAGARAFRSSDAVQSVVDEPLAGGTRAFAAKLVEKGVAPKLTASWQARPNLLFYVQAANGYRPGGYNTGGPIGQGFSQPGHGAQPYRRFQRDQLWNYEAGARLSLWDGRLRLRAAGFYSVWSGIQADQLLDSGLSFTANIGSGHVGGVELEGELRAGEFDLRANALVNDPELVRADPAFAVRADTGLPGVPRVAFGADLGWRRTLAPDLELTASAGLAYVGASSLIFDLADGRRMGDYLTTHADLGVEGHGWRVGLFAENLFDGRGDTFAYGDPFTIRLEPQTTPQRPRTLGLSLSRRY